MATVSQLLSFHDRFWVAAETDELELIEKREHELGIQLPELLRATYAKTSLRDADQLHLLALAALSTSTSDAGSRRLLWIASEQQGCWAYGLSVSELHQPDPPIYSNESGEPEEKCTLSQFLEYFWIVNRPHVPPTVSLGDPIDVTSWSPFTNPLAEVEAFWLKDGLVYETYDFGIGARSKSDMERLLAEVGDPEFDEVAW